MSGDHVYDVIKKICLTSESVRCLILCMTKFLCVYFKTQNTYNEEHKGTRGPGKGHKVTITTKEQTTQHGEDHPRDITVFMISFSIS